MIKLAALLGLAVITGLAQAQPQDLVKLPSSLVCGAYDPENSPEFVEKYGEKPFLDGSGQVVSEDTRLSYNGRIRMYLNPQTGSYTLLIDIKQQFTCMVISGNDAKPMQQGNDI